MLLYSQSLLKYFHKVNQIGAKSHICIQPLKWDENLQRFSPQCYKFKNGIIIIHIFALAGISFVQLFLAVTYSPKKQSESLAFASKCINYFFFSAFAVAVSYFWGLLKNEEEIVSLWNGVIGLEKQFRRSQEFNLDQETNEHFVRKVKFVKIFCKYQAEVSAAAGLAAGLAAAVLPSFPTNFLFYFLYENGIGNSHLELFERGILFALHAFAFHMVPRMAIFYIVQVAIVVNCLIAGLFRFKRMVVGSIRKGSSIETSVRFYRQLQILAGLSGEIHRKVMAFTLFTAVGIQIISVFMLAKFLNENEEENQNRTQSLALAGLFGVASVEAFFVILGLYGLMAELHHECVCIKESIVVEEGRTKPRMTLISQDKGRSGRKLPAWKMLKTFPHLKVVLGSGNFLEKTSPLKFEDFAMGTTVNLLLIN